MIRLDKYLADTGAASRREAKAYIRRGEVTVDGVPAAAPEQKIAETAVVCLRGSRCTIRHTIIICSTSRPVSSRRRATAVSRPCWICSRRSCGASLVPAGRLDKDTTGPAARHGRRRLCPPCHHAEKARAEGLLRAHGWTAHERGCGPFCTGRCPRRRDAVPARPAGAAAGAGGLPRHGL